MLMAPLIYCYNWQDILRLDQSEKRLITYMMKEWSTAVVLRVDLKVFLKSRKLKEWSTALVSKFPPFPQTEVIIKST